MGALSKSPAICPIGWLVYIALTLSPEDHFLQLPCGHAFKLGNARFRGARSLAREGELVARVAQLFGALALFHQCGIQRLKCRILGRLRKIDEGRPGFARLGTGRNPLGSRKRCGSLRSQG